MRSFPCWSKNWPRKRRRWLAWWTMPAASSPASASAAWPCACRWTATAWRCGNRRSAKSCRPIAPNVPSCLFAANFPPRPEWPCCGGVWVSSKHRARPRGAGAWPASFPRATAWPSPPRWRMKPIRWRNWCTTSPTWTPPTVFAGKTTVGRAVWRRFAKKPTARNPSPATWKTARRPNTARARSRSSPPSTLPAAPGVLPNGSGGGPIC